MGATTSAPTDGDPAPPVEQDPDPRAEQAADPRVERTRRRVLAAVLELIAEVGFGRVSTECVAARAGVARSTLYRNWTDLPTLVREALRSQAAEGDDPDTGELRGDLLTYLRVAAGYLGDRDLRAVILATLAEAQRDPDIARLHVEGMQARRARFRAVLERARGRGELPVDVELDVLLDDLIAPVFHRTLLLGLDLDAAFVTWHVERTLARHGG